MKLKVKVIYVEWEDSAMSAGWEQPHSDKPLFIRSAGILVRQGRRSITLSTSRSQGGLYVDQLTIPRSAIRKLRKIK